MRFRETALAGAYVIEIEAYTDERGFFARAWCAEEFARHGVTAMPVQASVSYSRKKGTLRGLHYQVPPSREGKLVRCTAGSIFDVIVDLRPRSPTRLQHVGVTLSAENRLSLYIPPGLAHGFQTLTADAEVTYLMTDGYAPALARGVRWDDPAFGIAWPPDDRTIAERDRNYADFEPAMLRELEGLQ